MKWILVVLFFLLLIFDSSAQEISVKERAEITYQSEILIAELENLMNIISNADITQTEIKELMENSYGTSKNKIFQNSGIVVEDDINPVHTSHINASDVSIEKYLKDLDLLYTKSSESTISFSNIKASSLKKKNYLYIRVYFESLFKGKHKEIKQSYIRTKRIAEVRADKFNNQWKTQIVSITFDDPSRPITSEEGNVLLTAIKTDVQADTISNGKVSREAMEEMVKKETRKMFEGYKVRRDSAYAIALNAGNRAFAEKNYMAAVESFTEAQNINPYEITPKIRINEITRAILQEKQNEKTSLEALKKNGDKEELARNYEGARNFYQQALSKDPDNQNLLKKIKNLDALIRSKAQFDSKYVAGNYDAAIKDYNNLIKENKSNPDYYLGRGKCYYKLRDPRRALADFSEAIRLDVNFLEAIDYRAMVESELKDYHNAIADYSAMISINKTEPSYFVKRAKVKVLLNDQAGAVKDYEEAIKLTLKNQVYYYEKGILNYKLKNYEKAKLDFSNAIAKDSSNASYYYYLGMTDYALNKMEEAGLAFQKAKAKKLPDTFTKSISTLAAELLKKGQAAFRNKDYKTALSESTSALLFEPELAEAWMQRGDALLELKQSEEAAAAYKKALALNEKLYMPYYKLGAIYFSQKEFDKAIENADKAITLNASFLQANLLLAKGLLKMNKNAEGITALNKALTRSPENAELHWYLGKCYYNLQNYKQAIEEFHTSLVKSPNQAEIYYDLGLAELAIEEEKSAITDLTKSIELGMETAENYSALGTAYFISKEYETAIKHFNTSIDKDKAIADTYHKRGRANAKLKNYDQALSDYSKAADMNKSLLQNTVYLKEKGFIELNLNTNKEALASFNSVLMNNEQHAEALYGKACALLAMGQEEEAFNLFEDAFKTKGIIWSTIKNDSFLQPIVKNKRFQDLVKKYL